MRRTQRWLVALSLALGVGSACAPELPEHNDDVEVGAEEHRLTPAQNPAMAIQAAGHGKVFGENFQELQLTPALIREWHESMRKEVASSLAGGGSQETLALLREADQVIASGEFPEEERELLRGANVWRLLQEAPAEIADELGWRNEVLNALIFKPAEGLQVSPKVADLLQRNGYFDLRKRRWYFENYVSSCRRQGVPIPPDWAERGTPWVYQGNLTHNMLSPGQPAYVYTYKDPAIRGGCVALPRGTGAPGSVAGIICQSATTGKACFWDNKLRTEVPERFLGWRGLTLRIAELRDGSNLASSCTGCHRGNNVFLMTPDDPVWARLMRTGLIGGTGTFTTVVTNSSDWRDGHPRYVPVTGLVPRAGWVNTYLAPGCAGGCHETPSVVPRPGTMPPACGGAGCYGP